MKRMKHRALAKRLGIRLVPLGPKLKMNGYYRFVFTSLMLTRGDYRRCVAGVRFYATSFGAPNEEAAWRKALTEFARAIQPLSTEEIGNITQLGGKVPAQ